MFHVKFHYVYILLTDISNKCQQMNDMESSPSVLTVIECKKRQVLISKLYYELQLAHITLCILG